MEEYRKLVVQGRRALTLSLPAGWARKHQLGKGSRVRIVEDGGGLRVLPREGEPEQKRKADLSGISAESINAYLLFLFVNGVNRVAVSVPRREDLLVVMEALERGYLGWELIGRSEDGIELKNTCVCETRDFGQYFRKMVLGLEVMLDDPNQHVNVHRWWAYCRRIASRKDLFKSPAEESAFIEILMRLEDILHLMRAGKELPAIHLRRGFQLLAKAVAANVNVEKERQQFQALAETSQATLLFTSQILRILDLVRFLRSLFPGSEGRQSLIPT